MSTWPLLSLLIWLPILGGFAVLAAGPRLSRPLAVAMLVAFALLAAAGVQANATIVQFQTSLGNFEVNLYDEATPETVANFLAYLKAGTYENTFFHRSVKGFVVQGGGFVVQEDNSLAPNPNPLSPINEPVYSNVAGTIVMAKVGNDVNGATNQWFFNLGDNSANLDVQNGGFTVFGEVMGDGFALSVGVGGEEDLLAPRGVAAERGEHVALSLRRLPRPLKRLLRVDAELPLRQVDDVAPRGAHPKGRAEHARERVRLRRRLYDQEAHGSVVSRR